MDQGDDDVNSLFYFACFLFIRPALSDRVFKLRKRGAINVVRNYLMGSETGRKPHSRSHI